MLSLTDVKLTNGELNKIYNFIQNQDRFSIFCYNRILVKTFASFYPVLTPMDTYFSYEAY